MSTGTVRPAAAGPDPSAGERRPATRRRPRVGTAALGSFLALLFLLPLWWTVAGALRPQDETFATLFPVSPWTMLPREVTLANVGRLFDAGFARAMLNSAVVTLGTLAGGLAVCAAAAFALAVLRFPGRGAVLAVMVVSFLIPFDAIAIPLMSIFREAGLSNSYLALILPGIGNGFAVFLLRGFFLGIPPELAEAARVDGLGWWGVFWRIYLPLSRPALIGAGLILFVFQWQAYLWPLLIAPDPDMKVAPVAIAQFAGQQGVDFGAIFAGATLTALVPLLVLLFFQRYFTPSVSASGLKG
ncbi:carbohydrate ABC transporter permease [Actinoplanes teichomyceticus]|uniref:Carbohydrate ABC transporter membrane protein 2 (CUT1 family) n=1 Tax=Actinoplanes teichomyceticus TaxID=1867 RepID=A0A561WBC8_ACTTI|nr:carbohydrate ABC transporter permease [Actinoplanes teichomyceticus]TWG21159.1 carbohydrate ABC transporter membrane protein 2 (CUT1 family) [Actinoplanes teichomyceticus]GIF14981.1 sn-glycerol-3-phosphate transport system permease protein UgpE [Actinoplanes teichomyceticus]